MLLLTIYNVREKKQPDLQGITMILLKTTPKPVPLPCETHLSI